MNKTKIEWAEATWNPITGCSKMSEGCKNCYAERMAKRLAGRYGYPKDEPFGVTFHPDRLEQPMRWRKPRRIFVCSMSDLFHKDVPFKYIADVFQCIADCSQHIFLILTKRPERMKLFFDEWWNPDKTDPYTRGGLKRDRPRLFLRQPGCSECRSFFLGCLHGRKKWKDVAITPNWREAEQKDYFGHPDSICDAFNWSADGRGHGVAVEMDNGEISVRQDALTGPFPAPLRNLWLGVTIEHPKYGYRADYLRKIPAAVRFVSLEPLLADFSEYPGIFDDMDWCIVGGESGPGARPMQEQWARDLKNQCVEAGVAFFYKQGPIDGKLVKMPELDGQQWAQYPAPGH